MSKFASVNNIPWISTLFFALLFYHQFPDTALAQEKETKLESKNFYSMIRSNSEKTWTLSSLTRLRRLNAARSKGEKYKRIDYLAGLGNNTLACQDIGTDPYKYFDCISDSNAFGFAINSFVFVDVPTKRAFVAVGKNASNPCTGPASIYAIDQTPKGPIFPLVKYWQKPLEADGTLQLLANKFAYVFGCIDEFPPDKSYKYQVTSSPTTNLNMRSAMPWTTMKKETIVGDGW